jgi:hypothetical protein
MPKKKIPAPLPARQIRADAQRNRERILEIAKEALRAMAQAQALTTSPARPAHRYRDCKCSQAMQSGSFLTFGLRLGHLTVNTRQTPFRVIKQYASEIKLNYAEALLSVGICSR